jgi:hypothetical protein
MLSVERSWIDRNNQFITVRHKTGRRVAVGLYPATLELIDATFPPERKLIWPLSVSREWMRQTFCKIVEIAGVSGSLKWLRAGSGTSVDELHGHGEQHLGNSRAIFERHYLCRKLQVRMPQEVIFSRG